MAADPVLQLHLEPQQPLEVSELTATLGSIARQYQELIAEEKLLGKAGEAKLLVSSVSPGSIDISLVPDFAPFAVLSGPLLAPLIDKYQLIEKFGARLKKLIEYFVKDEKGSVSVKDCDDAVNIARPIAKHGGHQTFNIIKAGVVQPIIVIDARTARQLVEGAIRRKSEIQTPNAEIKQRVPMIWSRLDRIGAKTSGVRSPDRGLIEEIDPKPHAVLFTDELTYLKAEMIADEENPMQKIYFVDVEVSRAQGKVAAYRIVGYHGKEDLE
jgi:hypothetical protein